MPTDSLTDRTGTEALMPEDVVRDILGQVAEQSVVMELATRLPNMSRKTRRLPVWQNLPMAYFVNGDTGLKQTTEWSFDNVFIEAEELAVIAPIPDSVLDDADYDLFEVAKPAIVSAIGAAVDSAILYGINAPASWPEDVVQQAENAGHSVTIGDVGDLYDDIMGEGGVLSYPEEDGFMISGHVAALRMKAKLRGLRDENGQPIFVSGRMDDGKSTYSLDGEPVEFPRNGAIDPSRTLLISGDWKQLVFAIRQDITWKVATEGVIQDTDGSIRYNLLQQDMTALRVVFRLGWALPNPVNLVNQDNDTRFPFAILAPVNAS